MIKTKEIIAEIEQIILKTLNDLGFKFCRIDMQEYNEFIRIFIMIDNFFDYTQYWIDLDYDTNKIQIVNLIIDNDSFKQKIQILKLNELSDYLKNTAIKTLLVNFLNIVDSNEFYSHEQSIEELFIINTKHNHIFNNHIKLLPQNIQQEYEYLINATKFDLI
jgi:hypothetical protein